MNFFKRLLHTVKPIFAPDIQERCDEEVSRNLVPATVDSIMQLANSGDITEQCKLASEILEKNADIMQAVSTRKDAVLGCSWRIEPADDTPRSREIADILEKTLKSCGDGDELDTFEDLLEDMLNALLPGFMVSEIAWCNGGDIAGFKHIEQKRFTFTDSFEPKLINREYPMGIELDRRRIIYHKLRFHGSDPVRGGLIRPLAWLHCFKTVGEKDLLGFIERYGMPFVAAKVDAEAFDKERNLIKHLVRNFGSSGGGIFTRNVELELLECASTGMVYFRLLEYLEKAVNKVILGQTASSGDSAGLSGGDAQSKVRQDILEADCRRLMRTINNQLVKPWMLYNYGAAEPLPSFVIEYTPPEDQTALATIVATLSNAGFKADAAELSKRFGLKLRYEATMSKQSGMAFNGNSELLKKYDAINAAIRSGVVTMTQDIEEQARRDLGLAELSEDARKSWEATGGIRQGRNLKSAESDAVNEELGIADNAPDYKTEQRIVHSKALSAESASDGLQQWLLPVYEELLRLGNEDLSEEEFQKKLSEVCTNKELFGNAEDFEKALEQVCKAGISAGVKKSQRSLKNE